MRRSEDYVMVSVSALVVPPLVQPRYPELPLGVLTVTFALPGPEIKLVVIVTCNFWLLWTVVVSVVPLMITTDDDTKSEPFTVRTKPCCTWANVIVLADNEPMTGAGRALPHSGLSALQPVNRSKASPIAHRDAGAEEGKSPVRDTVPRGTRYFANAARYVK